MKVTISVGGRFHAFDLAKELQSKGYLHQLVTSYPKFEVKKYGIKLGNIKSVVSKEIIGRINQRYLKLIPDIYICNWYDKLAAKRIDLKSDVYIIWSGFALNTIKKIKKHNPGAKIILERGSTHIQFQKDILVKAYSSAGIKNVKLPSKEIIEKETEEYELADYIAVPTNFVKDTFIEKGIKEDKIFVNPYGVDLTLFKQPHREIDPNNITILFTGMFSVRKGAINFLKIVEYLKYDERIKFLIVGGIEDNIESILKPYIDRKVTFQPYVKQTLLPEYYKKADIFLFPSIEEGLGMVQLQAMASSLVVLSSYNTGAGMFIENGINGFIFDPFKVEDYINTINFLLEHPEKISTIGYNASQKISNGFSWQNYGERYIIFLENLTT